jgi:UPF0176 protein
MSSPEFVVSAFYQFLNVEHAQLELAKRRLEEFCEQSGIRGLVVMGGEGINATIAGSVEGVAEFHKLLRELIPAVSYIPKESHAPVIPFARFKIDLRPEIITTKDLSLSSQDSKGTHLTPQEWHDMISNDPDVVIVDTRNDYETEIGVFEGAVDPKIKKFSDFQGYLETAELPRDKKLLLYCTGGIRCEKAVPEVKRLGYEKVYQLEGGILRYLEEFPDGHFKGECFVFDHRVAVDSQLRPTSRYKLCPHCGNTAQDSISCSKCGKSAFVCHRCVEREDLQSCSKNCAHHLRLRSKRAATAAS